MYGKQRFSERRCDAYLWMRKLSWCYPKQIKTSLENSVSIEVKTETFHQCLLYCQFATCAWKRGEQDPERLDLFSCWSFTGGPVVTSTEESGRTLENNINIVKNCRPIVSLTQMHFPRAAGLPISMPPLGHQLLSVKCFQGSCLSVCGQLCQARRAVAAGCTGQELQGVPSPDVCCHHGPAVQVSPVT